jgi:membrane-bound serine protease (ClpP class)
MWRRRFACGVLGYTDVEKMLTFEGLIRTVSRPGIGRLLLAGLLLVFGAATRGASEDESPAGPVVHIRVDSIIHPISSEFIRESLEQAERSGAAAMVIELSTPGGLMDSTNEITRAILNSDIPVVVYVGPSGARAASAGFFILMSADIAAMAPATRTGAAHPVGGQGEEIEGPLGEKVEQDAAADIRALAARHGRNEELAESAVVESRSFTEEEALEGGLIDLIAIDVRTLLDEIDGREIFESGGAAEVVRTAGAQIEELEMSPIQKLLATIAHPNIAYILMTLGGLGLYFELSNPGAVLPGVVGAICLVLAFFALSVLPVNYAGMALILLAMLFFIAEIKITSYGMLTIAGLVSLVLGSMMLFKSADPAIRVGTDVIMAVVLFTGVVVAFLMTMVVRAHRQQVRTGIQGMVNELGTARSDLSPGGKVFVHGELWNAVCEESLENGPIEAGTPIKVVAVDGMTLRVRPQTGDQGV